jgi:hypothetical protein
MNEKNQLNHRHCDPENSDEAISSLRRTDCFVVPPRNYDKTKQMNEKNQLNHRHCDSENSEEAIPSLRRTEIASSYLLAMTKKIIQIIFIIQIPVQTVFSQTWDTIPNQLKAYLNGAGGVHALYNYNDTLFVGGNFFNLQHDTSIYLSGVGALYNSEWIAFGTGIHNYGTVYDFQEYKGELYMGGWFSRAGAFPRIAVNGVPYTDKLAKWDGHEWKSAGITNPSSTGGPRSLEKFKNTLYVGLQSGVIDQNISCCVANFDGQTWREVPEHGGLYDMIVFDDALYIAGNVYWVDGVDVTLLAKYDGENWSDAGKGEIGGDPATSLGKDTINGFLYVSTTGLGISRWDGYNWKVISRFHENYKHAPQGGAMIWYHGELYSGGGGGRDGNDTIWGLARWNGKEWNTCGSGAGSYNNQWVRAFEIYHDTLYVGGSFLKAGGMDAHYLAKWHTPADTTECSYLQATIVGSPDTVYLGYGGTAQFHANIPKGTAWHWDFGDGNSGTGQHPIHQYTDTGTYEVKVYIHYKTCIDTGYHNIVVREEAVNTPLQTAEENIELFPNPAKNEINIHIKNYDNTAFHCQIINPEGKQIKSFTISDETYLLNTQDISSGIYYLIIETKNQRINKKMVIIK